MRYDDRIEDVIGNIINNLAFTSGRRLNLKWIKGTDGHNVYIDGKMTRSNGVLPYPSYSSKELFVALKSYNKALEDVYKLRTWDNKFWIGRPDDE